MRRTASAFLEAISKPVLQPSSGLGSWHGGGSHGTLLRAVGFSGKPEPAHGINNLPWLPLGLIWLASLGASVLALEPPLAAQDGTAALAPLEARLAADPDNLRAGSQYRQAVIGMGAYDRAIQFLEKLVADHPNAGNAHLNYGFAYVDKIPAAGSIAQVILANNALGEFTKSLELKKTWIALYTRGNSYLYWPKIFGRASSGVADLEEAMKIQRAEPKSRHHVRTFIALGDGYWKTDDLDKARAVWAEGLKQFPDNPQLKARMAKDGDDLKAVMDETYDITKRIDTSLEELWSE